MKREIRSHSDLILNGTLLAIDPSSGSVGSQPGYAIYERGKLTESGTIDLNPKYNLATRLVLLGNQIREISADIDVMAIEQVWKNNSLLKSCGAIISNFYGVKTIEVPAINWCKAKDGDYVKTDECDAIYIGKYVMEVASSGQ